MSGLFSISLDFELHWGGFEKWPLRMTNDEVRITNVKSRSYHRYFNNTRRVIPEMLTLFERFEVHVTWATVGMLFHDSKEALLTNAPEIKPSYKVKELSAYHYIDYKGVGDDEASDPFHFAPSLIQQIRNTRFQEIGTHTFAHYYCNEEGQTVEQFREDLRAARRAAKKFDVSLKSLVFPRNQFNDDYLRVCYEEGITSVRSNPLDWFWHIESTQGESAWKRLNRGLDAYFPIGMENTYRLDSIPVRDGLPVCLPASRLLRPYHPKEFFLNDKKISRIKSEITRAARNGEVYHLWWHPHNFGWYPEESLRGLVKILEHYTYCRERYAMGSMNMGELTEVIFKNSTPREALAPGTWHPNSLGPRPPLRSSGQARHQTSY